MENSSIEYDLEIVLQTKDLQNSLNFANSIVEKRNSVNELNNIKLTASGNELIIGATDIDLYLNQTIGAEVITEGVTTVSFQLLSDIVRRITDPTIKLIQMRDSGKIELLCENCRFELLTLPATKFPIMEDFNTDQTTTITSKELSKMLEYTAFSMSNEETRYNLNGIFLHIKDNKFFSAATDGHRLSVAKSIELNDRINFGVILPRKTVNELQKIIKDNNYNEKHVTISFTQNKIKFIIEKITLTSKLIDGVFPEYETFIPELGKNILRIKTKLLEAAIDRVAIITVDKLRAIKIVINEEFVKISATGESKGAAEEKINYSDDEKDFCKFDGEEIITGFNPIYILDVLNALKETNVDLHFSDSQSPLIIKTDENPEDKFVIMPVKV